MDGCSDGGVGGTVAGDEGAGVCQTVLSSSVGCEVICEDMRTVQMRPLSRSTLSPCWCTGQMMVM